MLRPTEENRQRNLRDCFSIGARSIDFDVRARKSQRRRVTRAVFYNERAIIIRGNLNVVYCAACPPTCPSSRRIYPFLTAALLMGATAFSSDCAGHLSRGENGLTKLKSADRETS